MGFFGIPPNVWFPVVTLVIGILLKALFDALSDKRVARRDSDAHREQRLDSIRLRRVEVQREALLELQSYSMALARSAGQINYHDTLSHRTIGDWAKVLPEDVNSRALESQVGTMTRRVRVRDADVRRLADELASASSVMTFARSAEASDNALRKVVALNQELQERIGLVLRELDDDEDRIVAE